MPRDDLATVMDKLKATAPGNGMIDTDTALLELNKRFAVVREAGKTVVIEEAYDHTLKRAVLNRMSFTDFRNFYDNRLVPVGDNKVKGLGGWWLRHADRRQYEGITLAPGGNIEGYYNLWKGFAFEPRQGDWSKMQAHMRDVICAGFDDHYNYLHGWCARAVQEPDTQGEVATAMRGPKGSGKSQFARLFGSLFGQHYLPIAYSKHLVGNFNAHLEDAIVVFADEAFWAGDRQGEAVLKALITEPFIMVERKNYNARLVKNYTHILMAANADWVVPASRDERRYFVVNVSDQHRNDRAYFAALLHEWKNGGAAAMLYDLMELDLSKFDVRDVPQTEALAEQKDLSMEPHEKWWFGKLWNGQLRLRDTGWEIEVPSRWLHDDYITTVGKTGMPRRSYETELGMGLRKLLPAGHILNAGKRTILVGQKKVGSFAKDDGSEEAMFEDVWEQHQMWRFPSLAICRRHFDQVFGMRHNWPDAEDEDMPF